MFYIGYKSDYTTACKKQLRDAEYIGRAANGAEVYAVVPDPNWADHRTWYYTMNGNIPGLCKEISINPYTTPKQMRELLAATTEERAAKFFLDVNGELDRIRSDTLDAITLGDIKQITDAIIEAVIGEVKETKHRAEIMELALDKMAEFVYETSAEQEMWKKEFIKQAEKELAEEQK